MGYDAGRLGGGTGRCVQQISTLTLTQAPFGDAALHRRANRGGDELVDRTAKDRDLLDQARSDGLQPDVGHQEYRFDAVVELLVHPRHLIFIFEVGDGAQAADDDRSEEHTSELQSLMRISYAVFCLTKKRRKHIK